MADKTRLDLALVARGLAQSREKAQALILSGVVFLKGQRADKASLSVADGDALEVRGAAHPYVSRGGLKLEKAMDVFAVDARGAVCMDVGASTGGFTDVLLRAGAKRVYAIDVGYGQLDWRLRSDTRVVAMERTNARHLLPEQFPMRPTLCVMDVSFISVGLLFRALVPILGDGGRIVTLVKPQFEAGRGRVGKKGVVREKETHLDVLRQVAQAAQAVGWRVQGADFSPVRGPEGNIEFLFDMVPAHRAAAACGEAEFRQIVEDAHGKLIQGLQ